MKLPFKRRYHIEPHIDAAVEFALGNSIKILISADSKDGPLLVNGKSEQTGRSMTAGSPSQL